MTSAAVRAQKSELALHLLEQLSAGLQLRNERGAKGHGRYSARSDGGKLGRLWRCTVLIGHAVQPVQAPDTVLEGFDNAYNRDACTGLGD